MQGETGRNVPRVGRVLSASQVQNIGRFGENQRLEPLASTSDRTEALLKAASVALGLGVLLPRLIHRPVGQADHDPSDRSQEPRGSRRAHAAPVFTKGDIQAMVQAACIASSPMGRSVAATRGTTPTSLPGSAENGQYSSSPRTSSPTTALPTSCWSSKPDG